MGGTFANTELRGKLKGKIFRSIEEMFPLCEDLRLEYKIREKVSMTRVHKWSIEIFADMTGVMWQRTCCEENTSSLDRNFKHFRNISVQAFDKHGDSVLYALKYHLLTYMQEDIRGFGPLFVLDSSV